MARIFTDGAEIGDLLFWNTLVGAPEVYTVEKRSGVYSYRIPTSASSLTKGIAPLSEFYVRTGIMFTNGIGSAKITGWTTSGSEYGSLRMNSGSSKIEAVTSTGTVVATGSIPLQNDIWYCIEAHVKIADSLGDIEVKVDGVLDIDFSGDTKPSTQTTIDAIWYIAGGGAAPLLLDDLALNDTTGVVDNSWCGDGHVLLLKPNAAGDVTQLTPSAGANYECVDDIPTDGDTSYVSSPTTDQYDLYNLEAFTPTGVAISRVWAEARARKSQADTRMLKFILKTHAVEYDGSSDLNLLTTHTQVRGTEQLVNPNTSAAWIISELDDLQVGPKVR